MPKRRSHDERMMDRALDLARRGYGHTSPNPMVGAVLTRGARVLGEGWHVRTGQAHAEINALRQARAGGHRLTGATLYVTLEPCSTQGRTPPCTRAILKAGLAKVVVAATDPNPAHAGRGLQQLREAGVQVVEGVRAEEAAQLNESFNHWIVHRTPWVLVKSALTLDGKIATANGESKWITGPEARARSMIMRQGSDAILVGLRTVQADNPSLTVRLAPEEGDAPRRRPRQPWRIILDTRAQTPLDSRVVSDRHQARTMIVTGPAAPRSRVAALKKKVQVISAPLKRGGIDLKWLLARLGKEDITSLLVEGGGRVNASFLFSNLAHRVAFFYAPKILGGHDAIKAVAGPGATRLEEAVRLEDPRWEKIGADLLLTARVLNLPRPRRAGKGGQRTEDGGRKTEDGGRRTTLSP